MSDITTAHLKTTLNKYKCICGEEWDDLWDCGCDDECPSCGTIMTPYFSEKIDELVARGAPEVRDL